MKKIIGMVMLILGGVALSFPAHAQQGGTSGDTPTGVADDAVEALGQERGKTEEEELEDILASEDTEYDLVESGSFQLDYSFNYSFISDVTLTPLRSVSLDTFTIVNLQRDSQHTARHNLNFDYGVFSNFAMGLNLPIVTKWNQQTGESVNNIGDIRITSRWQPFVTQPGTTRWVLNTNLTFPSGKSTFDIDQREELSTGSGLYSVGLSSSFSRVLDPVFLSWGLNLNYSLPRDDLDQQRADGILRELKPGTNIGFNAGLGYSLSYDVSLSFGFSFNLSRPTKFIIEQGGNTFTRESPYGTNGNFNISSGFRISPEYRVNTSLSIGLTSDDQDFGINVSFPLVQPTP